jgi:hypothetical protein
MRTVRFIQAFYLAELPILSTAHSQRGCKKMDIPVSALRFKYQTVTGDYKPVKKYIRSISPGEKANVIIRVPYMLRALSRFTKVYLSVGIVLPDTQQYYTETRPIYHSEKILKFDNGMYHSSYNRGTCRFLHVIISTPLLRGDKEYVLETV